MNGVDFHQEFEELKNLYNQNVYPSLTERRQVLLEFKAVLINKESQIVDALSQDYGYRSEFDTVALDIIPSVSYINYVSKKMAGWMQKEKRHGGLQLAPSKVEVHFQPLGVVGVVVPWNFPVNLAMGPAVSAIGAGNRVMIKMSEFTPHVNKVLIESFKHLSDHIRFYEGEVEASTRFTQVPFDHLLFTGSTQVGRIVAQAAAKNLTPVTLELGGKSPTIITEHANLDIAADSVIMGENL
jgi:coniferyl-aldehyde dehydrogenase